MSETTRASGSSIDEITELYKRDIDVMLIDGNLSLSFDARLVQLQRLLDFAEELRHAKKVTPTAS